MGWGQFTLMTDDDRDAKEVLVEFNECFDRAEILHRYPKLLDTRAYGYECAADCGVTVYCSECGKPKDAGCERYFLIITEEGAAAYCYRLACRAARDKMLRKLWPTVPFSKRM